MTDDVRQDYFRIEHEVDESTLDFLPTHGPRSEYPIYDIGDGIGFQPIWGGKLLLNWVYFQPNRFLPNHQHPEEQLGTIIEGEMELTIGGVTKVVRQGDVYVIPPNVPHSGRTYDSTCVALDIFSPPRSDFRELIARASRRADP